MLWTTFIFAVVTLKVLQCSAYGQQLFSEDNYPFSTSRTINHPGVGLHRNSFSNLGPTIHGPQVDLNSQPLRPVDDVSPFVFGNEQFDNRPIRENSFPRPQQSPRKFNGFIPSRNDNPNIGIFQTDRTFNERPDFGRRPSRQNPQGIEFNQRPGVNVDSSRQNPIGRPQFETTPLSQNFPLRPQPGIPFNGRPSINLNQFRQSSSGRPSLVVPDDRDEVFIFDRPTSPRPPTPARKTTTTTTARNCDCPSTPEFNPVCGTNGQTYNNPGKLKCARLCGTDVRVHYYGTCITTTEQPTASSTSATNNLF
ncbi:hypothetical protein L9F63_016777 [Diploptera punctata]|uniref:Kazal-like domain-containing protein n=1 Tax=Diploptera punctata TaxID=6984 RepID=A0AAD8EH45_DIPPU|nr:hypothetical protein L9F63_016777 [Diploptera punctata]